MLALPLVLGTWAQLPRTAAGGLGARLVARLPLAGALLAGAAVVVTVIERQWTTVSEMVLFGSGMVVFFVWVLLISLELRRAARSQAAVVGGSAYRTGAACYHDDHIEAPPPALAYAHSRAGSDSRQEAQLLDVVARAGRRPALRQVASHRSVGAL